MQTDELLENVRDEAEDTAWAGRVRLPRHVRARGVKAPRGENPVQCQWRNCANSFAGPDANKDLYVSSEHTSFRVPYTDPSGSDPSYGALRNWPEVHRL